MNKSKEPTFCKNCKHITFEASVLVDYIENNGSDTERINSHSDSCWADAKPKPPSAIMTSVTNSIPICGHDSCWVTKTHGMNMVTGRIIVITERVKGQAQLNKKYDCKLFEQKESCSLVKWFDKLNDWIK